MLTPDLFARVIAARGEVARPEQNGYKLHDAKHWYMWVGVPKANRRMCSTSDAHNACALHWLGMEAEATLDLTAYFRDGKVDIEALAEAVIAHGPKEGT